MRVLIIGVIPPPIGGVSIHLRRFVDYCWLNDSGLKVSLFDYKKGILIQKDGVSGAFAALVHFIKVDILHVHLGNNFKLFLVIISKLFCKKVVYTHHNSIVSNKLAFKLTCFFSDAVILVNSNNVIHLLTESARRRKIYEIPAFIPKLDPEPIPDELSAHLTSMNFVISTNCYSSSKIGEEEVYGIGRLIKTFRLGASKSLFSNTALVICDPSAGYQDLFSDGPVRFVGNGNKIIYWGRSVEFYSVIKFSDCTVRCTITDGDSISVRESIHLKVPVIASDCVDRPSGTILYRTKDDEDLLEKLCYVMHGKPSTGGGQKNYAEDVLDLYKGLAGRQFGKSSDS